MEDRLLEFRGLGGIKEPLLPQKGVKHRDSELAILPNFNGKLKILQDALNTVQFINSEITRLKEDHASAISGEQEKRISDDLNKKIDTNNQLLKNVKEQLQSLHADVEDSKRDNPNEPETRIKIINYNAVSNKLGQIIKESQAVQLEFKQSVRNKIFRQVKLYDSSLTDEQIEEIVNDPEGVSKVLANKMLGVGHVKLQNAVSDIQDKYKDILKLERSVEAMHQIFVDMAFLVQTQGEMIDNIEVNIRAARDYVREGVKELSKAHASHEKSRKWQYASAGAFVGIGIIVFLILYL